MSEHCTCATSDYCQVHDQIASLKARLAELEQELEDMTRVRLMLYTERDGYKARLAESEAECLEQARLNGMGSEREARLIARLAEAELDAARYRWLRERCYVWSSTASLYRDEQEEPVAMWLRDSMTLEDMDRTIDAARATNSATPRETASHG